MSTTLVAAVPAKTKTLGYGANRRKRRWRHFLLRAASRCRRTYRSKSFIAAYATPICTRSAMNGRAQRIRWCRDTRLLAA